MGDLIAGEVFADNSPGSAVNAARLNNHVNGASIAPVAISNKADVSSLAAGGDYLLLYQAATGNLLKVSVSNLFVASTQVYVGPSAPPASYQDAAHAWIKTNPSNFSREGLRFWDPTASAWRRDYDVPVGILVAYTDGTLDPSLFDGTGKGVNALDGWAHANGQNGTVDSRQLDDQIVTDSGGVNHRTYNVPANTITAYGGDVTLGGTNFDSTGLGKGNVLGWARCNGSNGTTNASSAETATGLKYIQFIGYGSLAVVESRYLQFIGYTSGT